MKSTLAGSAIFALIGMQTLNPAVLADDRPDLTKFGSLEELELTCVRSLVALEGRGVISAPKEGTAEGAAGFACGCLIFSVEESPELQTIAEEAIHALQEDLKKDDQTDLPALGIPDLGLVEQEASASASLIAAGETCPPISAAGGKQLAH